jgi:hypothetical protein
MNHRTCPRDDVVLAAVLLTLLFGVTISNSEEPEPEPVADQTAVFMRAKLASC